MSIADDLRKTYDERKRIRNAYEQGYVEGMRDAVKHGHWEDYLKSGLKYRCSFCKSRFNTAWEYCPHCGAKMDLLDDDTKWEVTENEVKVTKHNCTEEEIEEVKAIMGEKVTE